MNLYDKVKIKNNLNIIYFIVSNVMKNNYII
jgi:hypothetical protein